MMNRKIVGILIVGLFIGTVVFPCTNGYYIEYLEEDKNDSLIKEGVYQTNLYLDYPTPVDEYQVKIILNTESFE